MDSENKPFRLVKYFTLTSLILMILCTILLSTLNTHWVRTVLQRKSRDYATLIVRNLNHQIYRQFAVPVFFHYGKITQRNRNQQSYIDKVIKGSLHSFNVEMVNIYDLKHTVSYSYKPEYIGRQISLSEPYTSALNGQTVSSFSQENSILKTIFGFPGKSKITTTAPLRTHLGIASGEGPIIGVIEITQDVSDDYMNISRLRLFVILTSSFVMGGLFIILRIVVKKGEVITEQRTDEKIALKDELSKARHLSSLGEMTAGISHEMRNPLGIIMNSAELLQKNMEKLDPSNNIPQIIVDEARRMNYIITDFLDYAKPANPAFIKCNINEIITKNLNYLMSQVDHNIHSFESTFEDTLPEIPADSDMLYQAFLNILINAIQAMPDGGKVTIETYSIPDAVRIIFKDEGSGIPWEEPDKLWDPFFTTKEMGTGLGLGIIKNIIESHNGTITIANRPIIGALVIIELPAEIRE